MFYTLLQWLFDFSITVGVFFVVTSLFVKTPVLQQEDQVEVFTVVEIYDNYYMYDFFNNFMCQGNSLEDIANKLFSYKKIETGVIRTINKLIYVKEGIIISTQEYV